MTCSLGASAAAQSTHVHGQGQVGMAIDQNLISMTLESPGADIVGFEHEARTAEEKTAVIEALKQLSDPMFVIQLPANASCKVVQASSEVTSENGTLALENVVVAENANGGISSATPGSINYVTIVGNGGNAWNAASGEQNVANNTIFSNG